MKLIDQISEVFKDDMVIVICSNKMRLKLDKELAATPADETSFGTFESKRFLDIGITSFYRNGATVHYTNDLNRFCKAVLEDLKK